MSKFLTISLFAFTFALASQVHAEPSWAAAYTEAYEKDASGGKQTDSYSGYYCTVATAQNLFGGSAVGYLTDYFSNPKNYHALKVAIADPTTAGQFAELGVSLKDYADDGLAAQYGLNTTYAAGLPLVGSAYLAMLFYDNDVTDDHAFRVMANDADELAYGNAHFNDNALLSKAEAGPWTAVPEPTSALLLLIGMAGLALRRRKFI